MIRVLLWSFIAFATSALLFAISVPPPMGKVQEVIRAGTGAPSPEEGLKLFASRLNTPHFLKNADLVVRGAVTASAKDYATFYKWGRERPGLVWKVRGIVFDRPGPRRRANFELVAATTDGAREQAKVENVSVVCINNRWFIDVEEFPDMEPETFGLIYRLARPFSKRSKRSLSREYMKGISQALLMYASDNDWRLPPTTNLLAEVLQTYKSDYLRSPAAPASERQSYWMNPSLVGKSIIDIRNQPTVIFVYEGTKDGPVFRHDGRALITTCTWAKPTGWLSPPKAPYGSFMTKEEASKLKLGK